MPSALFVTTVPITLEAFLLPFADRFRGLGWRVDALANGATADSNLEGHFDERLDVAWSRDPFAASNVLGIARRVREIVASGAYDVVHVHTPIAAFMTRYALRRRPPASPVVVYTAHGFHFYAGQAALPHAMLRSMERLAAPWTDYLVTVNREDFQAAKLLRGISPARVRLIPGIGVDTEIFAPGTFSPADAARVRADLGVPADAFLIAMVAEFSPVKRHVFALDVMSRVSDPRSVLLLVGTGPTETSVRSRVNRLGLAGRVIFAGYRRDVPALLAASDASLLVSEREGLNRSVLESMASGRPVFGTRTRGIADAVGDEAGWIAGKNDPAGLASLVDAAASDPVDVARRGTAARARACAEFSIDRVLAAYEELYGEALASRV